MPQLISHVDWIHVLFSTLLLSATVQFGTFVVNIYKHKVLSAITYLGMSYICLATAANIAYPRLLNGGTGIASKATAACLVVGLMLAVSGFVTSGIAKLLDRLPRLRLHTGKHSTAPVATD